MKQIRISYVDDNPDLTISKYLRKGYQSDLDPNLNIKIIFNEVHFDCKNKDGYKILLTDPKIKSANIILIDSKLFENTYVGSSKFTGEEFKLILRKYFPYIEVIVITQDETLVGNFGIIEKYKNNPGKTSIDYYKHILKKELDSAIKTIEDYQALMQRLESNDTINQTTIEKISNSLDGISAYDELTSGDVDQMISKFEEIQRDIDEKFKI